MSDLSESYHDFREAAKKRREERRLSETETLLSFWEDDFDIRKITDYQFRVNSAVDIYPTNKKWHDLKTNKRGCYRDIIDFLISFFDVKKIKE